MDTKGCHSPPQASQEPTTDCNECNNSSSASSSSSQPTSIISLETDALVTKASSCIDVLIDNCKTDQDSSSINQETFNTINSSSSSIHDGQPEYMSTTETYMTAKSPLLMPSTLTFETPPSVSSSIFDTSTTTTTEKVFDPPTTSFDKAASSANVFMGSKITLRESHETTLSSSQKICNKINPPKFGADSTSLSFKPSDSNTTLHSEQNVPTFIPSTNTATTTFNFNISTTPKFVISTNRSSRKSRKESKPFRKCVPSANTGNSAFDAETKNSLASQGYNFTLSSTKPSFSSCTSSGVFTFDSKTTVFAFGANNTNTASNEVANQATINLVTANNLPSSATPLFGTMTSNSSTTTFAAANTFISNPATTSTMNTFAIPNLATFDGTKIDTFFSHSKPINTATSCGKSTSNPSTASVANDYTSLFDDMMLYSTPPIYSQVNTFRKPLIGDLTSDTTFIRNRYYDEPLFGGYSVVVSEKPPIIPDNFSLSGISFGKCVLNISKSTAETSNNFTLTSTPSFGSSTSNFSTSTACNMFTSTSIPSFGSSTSNLFASTSADANTLPSTNQSPFDCLISTASLGATNTSRCLTSNSSTSTSIVTNTSESKNISSFDGLTSNSFPMIVAVPNTNVSSFGCLTSNASANCLPTANSNAISLGDLTSNPSTIISPAYTFISTNVMPFGDISSKTSTNTMTSANTLTSTTEPPFNAITSNDATFTFPAGNRSVFTFGFDTKTKPNDSPKVESTLTETSVIDVNPNSSIFTFGSNTNDAALAFQESSALAFENTTLTASKMFETNTAAKALSSKMKPNTATCEPKQAHAITLIKEAITKVLEHMATTTANIGEASINSSSTDFVGASTSKYGTNFSKNIEETSLEHSKSENNQNLLITEAIKKLVEITSSAAESKSMSAIEQTIPSALHSSNNTSGTASALESNKKMCSWSVKNTLNETCTTIASNIFKSSTTNIESSNSVQCISTFESATSNVGDESSKRSDVIHSVTDQKNENPLEENIVQEFEKSATISTSKCKSTSKQKLEISSQLVELPTSSIHTDPFNNFNETASVVEPKFKSFVYNKDHVVPLIQTTIEKLAIKNDVTTENIFHSTTKQNFGSDKPSFGITASSFTNSDISKIIPKIQTQGGYNFSSAAKGECTVSSPVLENNDHPGVFSFNASNTAASNVFLFGSASNASSEVGTASSTDVETFEKTKRKFSDTRKS